MRSEEIAKAIDELTASVKNVRFDRLVTICTKIFGAPRVKGSHHNFRTPWRGSPRIIIQRAGRNAKPYQVRQVISALKKMRDTS